MQNNLKRFENKKVLMVGGNESIGVPCAVYGKNKKGFMEIVAEILREEGLDLDTINTFSMFINKNWNIDEILRHNLTIEEIKNMKIASIEVNRSDFLNRIAIPKSLELLDIPVNGDNEKRITDMIKDYEKVITFYQSGANNLMYEMQANPIAAVLDKKMRQRALEFMKDDKTIKKVISGMQRNIDSLLSINNYMELYVLSLYVPKLFKKLSERNDDFKVMSDFIERFNYAVNSLASSYKVKYVDISPISDYCAKAGVDFHCTQEGHEKLARIVLNAIYTNTKEILHITNNKFYYDNTGLDGMLLDAHKRLELYQNARATNNYDNTILSAFSDDAKELSCDSLIREHEKECLVYKKAKEFKRK